MAMEVTDDVTVQEDVSLAGDPECLAKAMEIRRELQAEGEKRSGIRANARQASQLFHAVEPGLVGLGGEYGGIAAAAFGAGASGPQMEEPELLDEAGFPVPAPEPADEEVAEAAPPPVAADEDFVSQEAPGGAAEAGRAEQAPRPKSERGPVTLPWEYFGYPIPPFWGQ